MHGVVVVVAALHWSVRQWHSVPCTSNRRPVSHPSTSGSSFTAPAASSPDAAASPDDDPPSPPTLLLQPRTVVVAPVSGFLCSNFMQAPVCKYGQVIWWTLRTRVDRFSEKCSVSTPTLQKRWLGPPFVHINRLNPSSLHKKLGCQLSKFMEWCYIVIRGGKTSWNHFTK